MKTLKSFMLILSIALVLGAVLVGSCSAQSPTNYLKVKGKVIGADHADVQVFALNESTNTWEEVIHKTDKTRYNLRLSTNVEYEVFFTADNGYIKHLHIYSGKNGMWIKPLDVDFTKNTLHASMYQNEDLTDYVVMIPQTSYALLE